jgi:hypothetical protein
MQQEVIMLIRFALFILTMLYVFAWTNALTLITGIEWLNWYYWMAYFGGAV